MRMFKVLASVALLFPLLSQGLVGCAPMSSDVAPETAAQQEPIVLRVSGYGTYEDPGDRLLQRHRLMAMRASKLDAYRALIERVYGTSLTGSSTVQDMVLQDDRYRTMVDSVIRGARVVSVTELTGGGFETILELVLEGRFRDCITNVNYFRYSEECRMQLPVSGRGVASDDVVISPGVFRELSRSNPRTVELAPPSVPDSIIKNGNSLGPRSNQFYNISKDK